MLTVLSIGACHHKLNDYENPNELDITSDNDNIIIWAINFKYLELLKGD